MLREQRIIDEVEILLPAGIVAVFRLQGQSVTARSSSCFVVKDAGDDPDITNGAEIHAAIEMESPADLSFILRGGRGVGRVTKPGLAVPVGEWAINPVPRKMILEGVQEVLACSSPAAFTITISIPNGEELATKTLNERLGIVGGLSILGTTGIVKPISTKAWTDTIDCAIDVALASGAEIVILSTGRTSELAAMTFLGAREILSDEVFVMMGDHVGYALRSCRAKGVQRVILAGQFAKLLKIACGHEQTHVSSSGLDLAALAQWAAAGPATAGYAAPAVGANTARQVLEESGHDAALIRLVCGRVKNFALGIVPGLEVTVMLIGYDARVLYFE